jgi:hypothetical protein
MDQDDCPPRNDFVAAGLPLGASTEIIRRWPSLLRVEKLAVRERLYGNPSELAKMSLYELLAMK